MGRDIVLDTPAGAIGAWRADPVGAPRGGIVVVQEIYGVNAHVRSVADRYAAEGYVAIAPAFFDAAPGAAHGIELEYTRGDTSRGKALVDKLGLEAAVRIVAAAADLLRVEGLKVGVVGFCWGGTVALLANTRLGLPASSYYGARNVAFLDEPLRAPMQFHFGEADPSIPPEAIEAHRARHPGAATFVYEQAGHAFNRDIDPSHHAPEAARAAHARTMDLFASALTGDGDRLHPQLAADSHPVAMLALCELRLMDDANYPWLVLVPRVPGARELIDLDPLQRRELTDEIDLACRLLRERFRPFKLNVAALGNLVPQLHVHVIARFEGDPAWPAPVWGRMAARPYSPEALAERIESLRQGLRSVEG